MLKVTLALRCNVCGGEQFMLPSPADTNEDIRCADCAAFKCKSDDLERTMAAAPRAAGPVRASL
ncbi:hypothetical protein [Salinicola avicenniae]|uniref:hypothetical protein n=1 Tax=Salinicola avicenniae TaxID=2916836 RepID=UPI0020731018|nr:MULTISPECIES: hypothetical protein [unclassified Salinicola]